jgi:hypothetical protein
MPGPDRDRGILSVDDRDYLSDRKNLNPGSERNARRRIRDRVRNGLYDFEYLTEELEDRDVEQVVTANSEPNEQVFQAAEDAIAFLFRMCADAPETAGQSTTDRFREVLHNGIEKGVQELNNEYELLDFKLDLKYGLAPERGDLLRKKLDRGEEMTLAELREALNNEYLDDSFIFRPLDQDGFPQNVDPEDERSHNDYRR